MFTQCYVSANNTTPGWSFVGKAVLPNLICRGTSSQKHIVDVDTYELGGVTVYHHLCGPTPLRSSSNLEFLTIGDVVRQTGRCSLADDVAHIAHHASFSGEYRVGLP